MYSSKKLFFHKLNKASKSQTYLQYSTVPFKKKSQKFSTFSSWQSQ